MIFKLFWIFLILIQKSDTLILQESSFRYIAKIKPDGQIQYILSTPAPASAPEETTENMEIARTAPSLAGSSKFDFSEKNPDANLPVHITLATEKPTEAPGFLNRVQIKVEAAAGTPPPMIRNRLPLPKAPDSITIYKKKPRSKERRFTGEAALMEILNRLNDLKYDFTPWGQHSKARLENMIDEMFDIGFA